MNGFSDTVQLTVTGQPAGVSVTLNPTAVTPTADGSATSTMTVTVDPSATLGTYTLTVTGTSSSLTHNVDVLLEITTESALDYELFIEIDYIEGHEPTQTVLDYIEDYYMGGNPTGDLISVTFHVDEEISYTAEYAAINDEEFSNIETQYNDHDNGYYSKWKWVLFGTTVEGGPDVIGYTYVTIQGRDILAGNYIFIADATADNWATENGIEPYGAEAAVLMHEMGHSIGIGKWHPAFGEQYDPDYFSVMSYLTTGNAGKNGAWYYSDEYWATRNMEYYTI